MPVAFNLVTNEETHEQSLIVMLDGTPEPVPTSHEHFDLIRERLVDGFYDPEDAPDEDEIKALVFERKAIPVALNRLSERVTLRDGNLFFDHDAIDTALSRHIVRLASNGDKGLAGFVKFMENLAENPSKLSRVHLFKWVDGRDFTITDDGMIVAYKAVQKRDDGTLVSITSGTNTVYVDGEAVTGNVPNPIGAVVEIARSEVDPNRESECSYGLHVGTWQYVEWFGGGTHRADRAVLKVLVNPRDVVAVPQDHSSQKMRVSRYTILETIGEEIKEAILFSDNPDEVSDDFEEPFEDEFDDDSDLEPDTTFEPTDPEPEEDEVDEEEVEDEEQDSNEDAVEENKKGERTLPEDAPAKSSWLGRLLGN